MASESVEPPALVTRNSWLGPLNLAAYITWAPICFAALQLHQLARSPLWAGDPRAIVAAALLVLFIGLFVYAASLRDRMASRGIRSIAVALALAQGVAASIANLLLSGSAIIILLILVAAQLGAARRSAQRLGHHALDGGAQPGVHRAPFAAIQRCTTAAQ